MKKELVWYASYGSNLLRSRFMCYIRSGRPKSSSGVYGGCTDKSEPVKDKPVRIPHQLYFSRRSSVWGGGGVAFIKPARASKGEFTLGRMYLITREQFTQVVRQENRLESENSRIKIDFEKTITNGQSLIGRGNEFRWYGRVIYLGEDEGYPIFTFTAKWKEDEIVPNPPSEKYLSTIVEGVRETYPLMSNAEIESYVRRVLSHR